jgi:hypothetical protein
MNSIQLHVILILLVVCVIVYVLYISKDILFLEKQFKIQQQQLEDQHKQIRNILRATSRGGWAGVESKDAPVQALAFELDEALEEVSIADLKIEDPSVPDDKPIESMTVKEEVLSEEDTISIVDTEDMEIEPSATTSLTEEEMKSMTWTEVKALCKERNISIKGLTKEQLIQKVLAN